MYWRLIPLYLYRIRHGIGSALRAVGEWFREIARLFLGVGRVLLAIGRFLLGIAGAIIGALSVALLLALLVGIAMGTDERGAEVAAWLFLPAWAGFFLFFFLWFLWQRSLKTLLEGILLILALEAFAFPLAGLSFTANHFERTVYLAGDQTLVWGNLVGVMLGGIGLIFGGVLVALVGGGLSFLLFLLLRLNLLHAGRVLIREARREKRRRMDSRRRLLRRDGTRRLGWTIAPIILIGVLAGLLAVGMAPGQATQRPEPDIATRGGLFSPGTAFGQATPEGAPRLEPLPGISVAPIPCPIMKVFIRSSLFLDYTEKGALGALFRVIRFKNGLLAALGLATADTERFKNPLSLFGLGTSRDAPTLQAARQRLESYLLSTGNPNLEVGQLRDRGQEIEGEIVTHSQELVERLLIDKRTGALRAVR